MIFNTLENAKAYAKQKLVDTDYVMMNDVKIANKAEFEKYRNQMRNLYLNPSINVGQIDEPKPIWIEDKYVPPNTVNNETVDGMQNL